MLQKKPYKNSSFYLRYNYLLHIFEFVCNKLGALGCYFVFLVIWNNIKLFQYVKKPVLNYCNFLNVLV